jgi:hypothetical protein
MQIGSFADGERPVQVKWLILIEERMDWPLYPQS